MIINNMINSLIKSLSKRLKGLIIVVAFVVVSALMGWWLYSFYKFVFYKPSVQQQRKLVDRLRSILTEDGVDVAKLDDVKVVYNPKLDEFSYIVKVKKEPYTYECQHVYKEPRNIICHIQEVSLNKVQVLPSTYDKQDGPQYKQAYNAAYKKLVSGLLLERYLLKDIQD